MTGFYFNIDHGKTQARIAMVESDKLMRKVPQLLPQLIKDYLKLKKT
jgi:hypothetical protein